METIIFRFHVKFRGSSYCKDPVIKPGISWNVKGVFPLPNLTAESFFHRRFSYDPGPAWGSRWQSLSTNIFQWLEATPFLISSNRISTTCKLISILFPVGFPKEISSHWHVGFWFEKWHATRSWMDCQCQHHHKWLNTFPVIWTCLSIGTLQLLCQKIGFSTKLEKNILDDRMSIFQSEKHHAETYRSNLPIFTQVIDSLPFHSKNLDTPVVPSANPLPQTSVLFACRCYQQSRLWCFTKSPCQVVGFGGKKRWAGL